MQALGILCNAIESKQKGAEKIFGEKSPCSNLANKFYSIFLFI